MYRVVHDKQILVWGVLLAAFAGCDRFLLSNPPPTPPPAESVVAPLTRERHVPYFPIDQASAHTGAACESCHQSPDSLAEFTCVSCHEHSAEVAAVRHEHVTGYNSTPQRASQGAIRPAERRGISVHDHSAKFFPIETGKHSGLACAECHQDANTRETFTCVACHPHAPDVAAMRHTFITGFVYESKACLNCHPTGGDAAISVKDHSAKFFPIETGAHTGLACKDCHDNPADSSSITCLSCHPHSPESAAARHENITGFVYSTPSCMNCHPKGAEAPISNRDHSVKFFPIETGDTPVSRARTATPTQRRPTRSSARPATPKRPPLASTPARRVTSGPTRDVTTATREVSPRQQWPRSPRCPRCQIAGSTNGFRNGCSPSKGIIGSRSRSRPRR